MRFTIIFLITIVTPCLIAQENVHQLISNERIDFRELPSYSRFVNIDQGDTSYKPAFSQLENLELKKLWYYSDGLKINGFILQPKTPGKYPVIVFNRGGNRDFGKMKGIHIIFFLGKIADAGYTVVASNYRGDGLSEGKDEFGGADVNDITNLIKILPEIETADTSKIGMYGWSRGGMMTYIAMTRTNKLKAVAVGGGVTNSFTTIKERPGMEGMMKELIPNYESNKDEELKARSAVYFADKFSREVPILIVHGNSDWRVKSSHAYELAQKLDELRIPYRLKIYEGADHGITQYKEDVNQEIIQWFDRFLKNEEGVPNMEYHGR